MKLGAWLRWKGMTAKEFADRIGRSPSTITRLLPGEGKKQRRHPGRGLAREIKVATDGAVTLDDFVDDESAAGGSGPALECAGVG